MRKEKVFTGTSALANFLIASVYEFLIIAFSIFIVLKQLNKFSRKKEVEVAVTTKKCKYCCTEISIEATRCPHCTSILDITEEV